MMLYDSLVPVRGDLEAQVAPLIGNGVVVACSRPRLAVRLSKEE